MIDSRLSTSTRPYLLRALYEWCADNALTPYIAAYVDESVKVPREYVKNNEIVLNISMQATSHLVIDNESVRFKARFGGVAREIVVPIDHVIAIYARENGQGMAFPVPQSVPPRGEVQDSPAAYVERKPASLRPVPDVRPEPESNILLEKNTSPTAPVKPLAPPTPSLSGRVRKGYEPTQKIVPLRSGEPGAEPPEPGPGGAGGAGTRPSLTRIK